MWSRPTAVRRTPPNVNQSAPVSFTITVNAANDGPVNTVPVPQGTASNTPLTFSSGNGNQISVADIDAGASSIQVTLTATNGTLTLSGISGLNFGCGGCAGDGTADATMTFQGTLTDVNNALNGLTFTPNVGYSGPASLRSLPMISVTRALVERLRHRRGQHHRGDRNLGERCECGRADESDTVDMVFTVTLNVPAPVRRVGELHHPG